MNAFQTVAPKGTTTDSPGIRLKPGEYLNASGLIIREAVTKSRPAPIIGPKLTLEDRIAKDLRYQQQDRWDQNRRSLSRTF